ncbi:MAG: signal recognition particle-docking protein FtsY [Bauldia sp.]
MGGVFRRLFGGDKGKAEAERAEDEAREEDDFRGVEALPPDEVAPEALLVDEELPPLEPEPIEEPSEDPEPERGGWFRRLTRGLTRSSSALSGSISSIFTKRKLDAETLEEFEEALIRADLGIDVAASITRTLGRERYGKELSDEAVKEILAAEVEKALAPVAKPLMLSGAGKPDVILVVGVNGTGKTTTIGKLAAKLSREGRKVMLAAGDTFRAAAIDQLKIWAQRTGSSIIAREAGADAAGLAFDALRQARETGVDVLIIDTAGRLQNRTELMAELEKVIRVLRKQDPATPHHTLLTLDATTGQNALSQVEIFQKTAGVTGLVMTKLDGTARGGILVALASKFGLPVHFIGVGEGIDDLEPFAAQDFARAIAGLS